jgi:thymidylate synthase (FAD)
MGEVASSCWNSTPSPQIGIDCIESGHGRVLEYADVTIEISGYSARCIREIYTHIAGTSRLQSSTRYINYGEFNYIIPDSIKNNREALSKYNYLMANISQSYKILQDLNIPKEDIANILPLGMESKMVLKINARAILHMAELRLCNRAYWEFRNFMKELLNTLSKLNNEWAKIVSYAKPKCKVYGYCNEKNSCKNKK